MPKKAQSSPASKTIRLLTLSSAELEIRGEKIQIMGFGKFYVQERKAREGRNPQAGEKMATSKAPSFSAGNSFKEAS